MNERSTEQKKIILGALTTADHPTASEMYEIIHRDYPTISRATVFRVLSHAADGGVIRRIDLFGEDARYDFRMNSHAHMHCLGCGKIFDILDSSFDNVLKTKKISDFDVFATELEFVGRCGKCLEKIN